MNKLYFYLLLTFLFLQCKNNSKVATENQNIRKLEMTQEFKDFISKFESDSVFQMSHISFPLEGAIRAPQEDLLPDEPERYDSLVPYKWRKNKWKLHREFNSYDSIFQREYFMLTVDMVLEKTSGVNGLFQMERRFAKMSDGWNLIYYSVN
jgi:hypothetical protein